MAERELRLETGSGEVVVRWDATAGDGPSIDPEPSPGGPAASARVLAGRLEDGVELLVAAARPPGAEGHGDDAVGALEVHPDGTETRFERAMISVEYEAGGAPRRLTLELDPGGEAMPVRGAADTASEPQRDERGWSCEIEVRVEGVAGTGTFTVVEG